MVNFQNNVSIVLQTINRYRYGPRAIKLSVDCYSGLLFSMKKGDVNHFSLEYALEWCLKEVAKCKQSQYKYSLLRLADVYEHGKVMANHLIIYRHPSEYYQQHISDYISAISATGCYKQTHLSNIQDAVEQFCCFIEYQGILKIEDLGYPALEQYDSFLRESSDAFFITEGLVSGFLKHLADRNICSPGYGLFMHYVESSKCLSYNDLSQNAISDIELRRDESKDFPAIEFFSTINDFTERLKSAGYSETVIGSAPYHLTLLYLFLDREGLGYDRRIVEAWFEEAGTRLFRTGAPMARRTFEMYDDYTREGGILPSHWWKHNETDYDRLPAWCQHEIEPFVDAKQKEGWSESTVNMYRTCVTKFCLHLDSAGIASFGELSAADIKDFNNHDKHKTYEAKNAYNSRIRKFLIFLELKGLVPAGLHFALPNHSATEENIVETLNDEDLAAIDEYCRTASLPIRIRDAAILLIALDTGLRSSDIVGLKISNIDWKQQCIRIVQQKTGVGRTFPLETSTCNAIYRYLKDVRHRGTCHEALFLSMKAPFGTAPLSACSGALRRAGASTGRVHLIRKTVGSMTMNSGASAEETALLLGHSDTSCVHKYTSLDPERSRLCPLSLAETGLSLEGRYGCHG